jgi:hypothetical protein
MQVRAHWVLLAAPVLDDARRTDFTHTSCFADPSLITCLHAAAFYLLATNSIGNKPLPF